MEFTKGMVVDVDFIADVCTPASMLSMAMLWEFPSKFFTTTVSGLRYRVRPTTNPKRTCPTIFILPGSPFLSFLMTLM